MPSLTKQIKWFYREFGIKSLHDTGRDAWLIILTRCCRMLAYGTNSLVLALFFSALQFTDFYIGLFMTLTLLGDVVLSLLLTLVADRVGRRRILVAGAVLMILSGVTFAVFENFWILLFAAVVGVISATGGDFGPFRAIEESTLSHLTTPQTRADVLAWYVTTASIGSAVGTEIAGRVVESLQHREGWTIIDAYHTVFWMYSGMGILNTIFTLMLSAKCEVEKDDDTSKHEADILLEEMEEGELSDHRESSDHNRPPPTHHDRREPQKKSRFAQISRQTRSVMYKLWFLLVVDSLADGMTGYSLTDYYMDLKFKLSKAALGDITSISYFLAAGSTIFAGPLSRHLGLIKTMVFTHLPSSAAVLLFPVPSSVFLTVALFFLRTGLNNMDQAPRSAFIAAVVKPEERTAVMGITSMLRTLAAAAGPSVTGILAGNNRFWIAFVAAGVLRIAYDLGLFALFVNMQLHQHEQEKGPGPGSKPADGSSGDLSDEEELSVSGPHSDTSPNR